MKENTITQGLSYIYFEKVLSQLVSLVVTIVLARILSPHDYGLVAILIVFLNIADVFVTAGLGNALIQQKNIEDKDYSTILTFSLCLSFLLYLLFFVLAPYIAIYYKMPMLKSLLRVLALRLPLAAFTSVQQAFISRNMLFHKQLLSTLIGCVVSAVVGIYMAINGSGAWALVIQYVCNAFVSLLVLQILIPLKYKVIFAIDRFKKLFSFGWKLLVTALIDRIYNEVRSLVIGKMFTPSDLAFYTKGQFFPNLLMSNIDSSMTRVLFPVISRQQDDLFQVREIVSKTVSVSSYLVIPILVLFSFIAEKVVYILLTDKWLPCVPYLQIFCIYYMFTPIKSAKYQAITAIGRADISLRCEIIQKIFGVAILLYTIFICRTVLAIALGNIVFTIITVIITAIVCKKYIKLSYNQQFKDIFHSIVISIFLYVILLVTSYISINIYLDLLIQSLIFVIAYISISKMFGFDEFVKLENMFFSFWKKKRLF